MTRFSTLAAPVFVVVGLATGALAQEAASPVAAAPAAPAVTSPAAPAPTAVQAPVEAPANPAAAVPAPAAVTPPAATPAETAPVTPDAAPAEVAPAQAAPDQAVTGEPLREIGLDGRRGGGRHHGPHGGQGQGGGEGTGQPVPAAANPALPSAHDMSPMGMYNQADIVVKSVMIMLVVACFLTWTVFLFKIIEIAFAKARARKAASVLSRAPSLQAAVQDLGKRRDPGAFMARAIQEEYNRSDAVLDAAGAEGLKERAVSIVGRVDAQAAARLRRGMGLLATVGSVSPFVGLFGTVWGIMNSFIGIAETQTTNLAVVAPGIAEALFATAIGLVAAIPAVVIYNHFTRGIAAYKLNLGDAGAAALRLLSRDIDFRHQKGV